MQEALVHVIEHGRLQHAERQHLARRRVTLNGGATDRVEHVHHRLTRHLWQEGETPNRDLCHTWTLCVQERNAIAC